jgi:hypothetical protein
MIASAALLAMIANIEPVLNRDVAVVWLGIASDWPGFYGVVGVSGD